MRKLLLVFGVTICLFFSCTPEQEKNVAFIKGSVPIETNSVKFEWIKEHTADVKPKAHIAQIDSLGYFELEIPVQQLSTGIMSIDNKRFNVAFSPNDQIEIEVGKDTIIYQGTGSAKNNFLYALSKHDKCDRNGIVMSWYREDLEFEAFFEMINEYIDTKKQEFEKFNNTIPFNNDYVKYFEIENELEAVYLYQEAAFAYSYKKDLPLDSVQVPKEYVKPFSLRSLQSDTNLIYYHYVSILNNILNAHTEKIISESQLQNKDSVKLNLIMDSLTGLTREHYMAKRIYYNLFIYDKFDSALVSSFKTIKSDHNCISVVNTQLEKYNKKKAMLGEKLPHEILQTALRDTANHKKTLADILETNTGKVIYLDIWSLGCGPCRMAMPLAKKLKEKLKDYPVAFVYITVDDFSADLWDDVFEVALGKENHYRLEKSMGSRLTESFGIMGVPTYMLFDTEGRLVSYNAQRPYNNSMQENPKLEKELVELAEKI